jgi:hypothetical protein
MHSVRSSLTCSAEIRHRGAFDDAVVEDGLRDRWSRILRLRNVQVNESGGAGATHKGLVNDRPHIGVWVLSAMG